MEYHSTPRLRLAIVLATVGLVIAVAGGHGSVAVLVAPWFLLAVIGIGQQLDATPRVTVNTDQTRAIVGDAVNVTFEIDTDRRAVVTFRPRPMQRYRRDQRATPQLPGRSDVIAPGVTAPASFPIIPGEWGVWDLGGADITIEDPLGLTDATGRIDADATVRVHPSTASLRHMVRPVRLRRTAGVHRSREAARGVEFADLRAYTSGDSLREINWRASARGGELVVSQRHPDRAADVVMLIDSFTETGHDLRRVLTMEIECAMAIAGGHLGVTDRVGIVEFGGLVRWISPGVGDRHLHRLTDALLQTSLYENAADKELPRLSRQTLPAGCMVVALSPLLDERFVDALHEARRRGHDVCAIECEAFGHDDGRRHVEAGGDERLLAAQRLRAAARVVHRDDLIADGIAVTTWRADEPVTAAFDALNRLRTRTAARQR